MERDTLESLGIEKLDAVKYYTRCPRCAASRSKKESKSLLVVKKDDSYVLRCFHHNSCEWNKPKFIKIGEDIMLERNAIKFVKFPKDFILPDHITKQFSKIYTYRRRDGEILFFKGRIDAKGDNKKSFKYIALTDENEIVFNKPPFSAIYAQDKLRQDSTILIVEGEKAVDYGNEILNKYNIDVISWEGGASKTNIDNSPFETIQGRNIILWSDNDDIGKECMSYLANRLQINNNVRVVDTSSLGKGEDIADISDIDIIKKLLKESKDIIDLPLENEISIDDMLALHSKPNDYYPIGFDKFDKYVRLPRNGFVVISGRTGHGKSVFMVNIAYNLAKAGVNVLFLSYELPRAEMDIRFVKTIDGQLYGEAGWEEDIIYQQQIASRSTPAVNEYIKLLQDKTLRIVDGTTDVPSLISTMNKYSKADKPLVVICDYAQIIPLQSSDKNRYIQLKEMVELFRRTANKNNQLFIAGSQLTAGETAYTDSVRESKDIEFSATLHLKVWRKQKARNDKEAEYYKDIPGQTIVTVEKSRQVGADGKVFGFNSTNGHKLEEAQVDLKLEGEF